MVSISNAQSIAHADLLFGYVVAHGGYLGGDRVDTVWLVAMTLMFLGAACQLRAHSQPALTTTRQTPALRFHLLPYLAVAAIYGLLIVVALGKVALYPLGGLLAGAALLTALVSARQVIAMSGTTVALGSALPRSRHRRTASRALPTAGIAWSSARPALRQRSEVICPSCLSDGRHRPLSRRSTTPTGMPAAIACLPALARSCRRHVRPGDIVGRYGGDELRGPPYPLARRRKRRRKSLRAC